MPLWGSGKGREVLPLQKPLVTSWASPPFWPMRATPPPATFITLEKNFPALVRGLTPWSLTFYRHRTSSFLEQYSTLKTPPYLRKFFSPVHWLLVLCAFYHFGQFSILEIQSPILSISKNQKKFPIVFWVSLINFVLVFSHPPDLRLFPWLSRKCSLPTTAHCCIATTDYDKLAFGGKKVKEICYYGSSWGFPASFAFYKSETSERRKVT